MNLMFRTKFILGVSFLSVIACAAVFIEFQNIRDKGHGFHQGSRLNSNKILPLNPEASAHALVNPPARYSTMQLHRSTGSNSVTATRKPVQSGRRKTAQLAPAQFRISAPEIATFSDNTQAEQIRLVLAAQRVERQAQSELELLTDQFDLTTDQQKRIFPLLALATADYHPGMSIGVASYSEELDYSTITEIDTDLLDAPDTVEDAIYDALDSDQQDAMIDAAIDNQLWWTEVVDQLEASITTDVTDVAIVAPSGSDSTGTQRRVNRE